MRAVILSTGDELTTGRTIDTNASFLSDHLTQNGVDVVSVLVVGDYPDRLSWAWETALGQADLVLSTGGLGPTADDLTTETVAKVLGRPLRLDQDTADRVRQLFESMGRSMPQNNLKQALFPEGATIIPNALGTAPGFRFQTETAGGSAHGVVLPGVPREMKPMLVDKVLPWMLQLRGGSEVYRSHTFQTFGISESALDELVAGAVDPSDGRVAFRAAFPKISVRVTVQGNPAEVDRRLNEAAARLRERVRTYCYAEGEATMEEVVGHLLTETGRTIGLAESCTGGLIGHRLTAVPGSSAYLLGGIVAYHNSAKTSLLGVDAETLECHGAVSREVAEQMAAGARSRLDSTLGLATTGIAGPDGGTPEKPVGTVCIALASENRMFSHRYQLWGNREWIKLLTSQISLDWVRRVLLNEDPLQSAVLRK